jgi:photosystem II stability/assembly factor-like uncharacterized protein
MSRLKKPLLVAGGLSLALCLTAHADVDDQRAREAGPEDGILCCNGIIPFLFQRDAVLTTTGRAGIFRSERRGERWQRSMSGLVAANGVSPFVGFVCQAPSQPRIIYALAGTGADVTPFNGLFSSDDFGETWTRRGQVSNGFGFNMCAVDAADPRTVYVSGFDDIDFVNKTWKSNDGGQTVQEFGASLPACAAGGLVQAVRGILYVSNFFECVAASTDGGLSFRLLPVPRDLPGSFKASPDGRMIFLSTIDASFRTTGNFRSTDGGASFVPVSGLPNGGITSLAFDPTDPSRIYTSDGLLRVSTDGGLSFALLPASNDPRFFGSRPIEEIGVDSRGSVYLSTLAGPFRTDDGGQTFRSLIHGFRAPTVQDLAFDADGKLLVGVFHTQMVFRQTDGLKFLPIGNAPIVDVKHAATPDDYDPAAVAASPSDANVILVALKFDLGVLRTDDGGRTWTAAAVPGAPLFYSNSRMVFPTSSRVYLASPGSTPGLYRSDDAGRSFAKLSRSGFGAIAVDSTDANVLYVGTYSTGGGLFKSTDGGQTLQSLGQPGRFSALLVDRRNPQVVYAGARFGQVIRSLDGGQTFAPASAGLAGAGVHGLAQDGSGTLYVWLRAGGLFASHDGASTWQAVDTGEALRRSGVESGRGALVADPHHPGRVYLGNAGVIQVGAGGDEDHDD